VVSFILSLVLVISITALSLTLIRLNVLNKRTSAQARELKLIKSSHDVLKKQNIKIEFLSQEKERRRIADGLHDELNASLITIKLNLEFIHKHTEDQKTHAITRELLDLIADTVKRSKEIVYDITPNYLIQLGLVDSINTISRRINDSYRIKVKVQTEGEAKKLGYEKELLIYRIVQELINNSAKYSNAWEVSVKLKWESTKLSIEVNDCGVGLHDYKPFKGTGLLSIKRRLLLYEGTCEFNDLTYRGNIKISVPYEHKAVHSSVLG
jgi:signal transduction histidine kinase